MKIEKAEISKLKIHPENARVGNVEKIIKSVERHGQIKPLLVQKSTNYVLAGNHTLKALEELNFDTAEIIYLDVDDKKAKQILLNDNFAGDGASYDTGKLAKLIQDFDFEELAMLFTEYRNVVNAIKGLQKDENERVMTAIKRLEVEITQEQEDELDDFGIALSVQTILEALKELCKNDPAIAKKTDNGVVVNLTQKQLDMVVEIG